MKTAETLAGKAKQVYILLLNCNNWKYTTECLASLQDLDYDDWRVLVVDNGSTDESLQRIRERFPEVEILQLKDNLGFAVGNNAGIRVALERGAEYVWVLNNDTTVDPKALRAMVEKAESDPRIGAVGSAIYSMEERERIQTWGGGYVNFWLGRSRYFLGPVNDEQIEFVTGASLLLRRPVLETLGLLDEGFFIYWEDTDYCFRLRKAGWRLAVAGNSKVWHKETGTIGKKSERLDLLFNRSAVRFFKKHSRVPLLPISVSIILRIAKRALAGDWKRVRAVWAGVREAETSL